MPPSPRDERRTFSVATNVFLRGLSLIYLIAFASLWSQIDVLVGPTGLLPAQAWLDAVAEQLGPNRWWQTPTLCWWFGAEKFLHVLCASGVVLALLAFAGVARKLSLALLWIAYLSLCTVGQDFLNFQWDALLLESGLLAVVLAPARWLARPRIDPPRLARWLVWLLLFRLMFLSGLVKLTSGDDAWLNFTALTYHYETQPLPTCLAWWAHQAPLWFQRASCIAMFVIELPGAFLLFGPRRVRHIAVLAQILLQLLIALTGNYTFFNLLTIVLCLMFFDDAWWARWFGVAPRAWGDVCPPRSLVNRLAYTAIFVVFLGAAAIVTLPSLFPRPRNWPPAYLAVLNGIGATRSVNSYGLFRVMTKLRPEIVFEGSNDGRTWHEYELHWKPGDVMRRPSLVAPHQPRVDWQLWFAALAHPRREPWVLRFCEHLLRGSPTAKSLLTTDPFPDEPPRYVRALVYDYRFTTREERARTGAWWHRDAINYYVPPIALRSR